MGLIVTITCADEVRREKLRFSRPVILRVFPHNPSNRDVAQTSQMRK
jgi:hypothetical protein